MAVIPENIDPMTYIDTDNVENNQIRDSLFKQMKKYEDKEGICLFM